MSSLPDPHTDERGKQTSCLVQILVAIIGAIAIIVAGILGNEKFIDKVLQVLETETITIYATKGHSGAAIYLAGNDMLTFEEASRIGGVGDTETDQLSKSYFSFYLGDIPQNAKIIETKGNIPCDVVGNPQVLGYLVIKEFAFGQYDQTDFYNVPQGTWEASWDGVKAIGACKSPSGGSLSFSTNTLSQVIQRNLPSQWIQFVFYFRSDLIIPNKNTDAIVLRALPTLTIRYQKP